jgi:hypothetical protein
MLLVAIREPLHHISLDLTWLALVSLLHLPICILILVILVFNQSIISIAINLAASLVLLNCLDSILRRGTSTRIVPVSSHRLHLSSHVHERVAYAPRSP